MFIVSRCGLFEVDFGLADFLFAFLDQFFHRLFLFERDETETFSLIFRFVEWHFEFDDGSELGEMVANLVVRKFGLEAAQKHFSGLGLGPFHVHFLTVDGVIAGLENEA